MRAKVLVASCFTIVFGVIAQQAVTEAPTGFDTPLVAALPGSQSISNGIAEAPGDSFALDQEQFERKHDATNGLGPLFNAASCGECHQNGAVGAASQITELRVGHRDARGHFANPTVLINNGQTEVTARSIVNDRSMCDLAQEHAPETETIHSLRAVLNTLGDGFVEAVDQQTLLAIAANQPAQSGGLVHGEVILVPVLEAPGHMAVGRFGWKDQQPTVLSFVGDAYLNEMGVTNRLRPKDVTTVCKISSDPEDVPDSIGMANIDHFAQFIRGTKAPPRNAALAETADARAGQALFQGIKCSICHVPEMTTAHAGTVTNGGAYRVPAALGDKIIHPYGDFLLHDVGTGDGIVQGGPADTANKLRTAPLWGLHIKSRYMHDLRSLTLEDAISRHRGEARGVISAFHSLSPAEQAQITIFLKSL